MPPEDRRKTIRCKVTDARKASPFRGGGPPQGGSEGCRYPSVTADAVPAPLKGEPWVHTIGLFQHAVGRHDLMPPLRSVFGHPKIVRFLCRGGASPSPTNEIVVRSGIYGGRQPAPYGRDCGTVGGLRNGRSGGFSSPCGEKRCLRSGNDMLICILVENGAHGGFDSHAKVPGARHARVRTGA